MNKSNKIYFVIIAIMFVGYIVLEHYKPKPVNWQPDFGKKQKQPYACYILNKMMPMLFPDRDISYNLASFYQTIGHKTDFGNNLIIITQNFKPDHLDLSAMLEFVSRGNNVFISANDFSQQLKDSLNFKNSAFLGSPLKKIDVSRLNLLSVNNDTIGYNFIHDLTFNHFAGYDTVKFHALGTNTTGDVNFMTMPYYKGNIYLHCQPMAFTNYHILYGNKNYALHALSRLPVANIIWDEYYKPGSNYDQSPVRYILKSPALKYAYYLILLLVLVYMLFESKRKQRSIKIIVPLENESLKFVETVGQLYYKSKNHADLAKKKIIYFKEFLRTKYNIVHIPKNESDIKKMADKTGVDTSIVKSITGKIHYIQNVQMIHKDTLVELNNNIDDFKRKCL